MTSRISGFCRCLDQRVVSVCHVVSIPCPACDVLYAFLFQIISGDKIQKIFLAFCRFNLVMIMMIQSQSRTVTTNHKKENAVNKNLKLA